MRIVSGAGLVVGLLAAAPSTAQRADTLPADLSASVKAVIADVMTKTQVPSASGRNRPRRPRRVCRRLREGAACRRRSPPRPTCTTRSDRSASSSPSRPRCCSQQEGKLSIDDPVSRWFPELTRASEVTLRNLMSHTSGYEDYAPQDYTIPAWTKPTTAAGDRARVGHQAARFRSGHAVPVQQHELQHRRVDRGEGERPAVLAVPQVARARPGRAHAHDRSRHPARPARADRLLPPRARPAAAGDHGGAGLVLRRRRDGDAGRRPAEVGHLRDERDAPAPAFVVRRDGNADAAQERHARPATGLA